MTKDIGKITTCKKSITSEIKRYTGNELQTNLNAQLLKSSGPSMNRAMKLSQNCIHATCLKQQQQLKAAALRDK